MRMSILSLALLSELRIWRCRELWCRSQTQLGSVWLWLWCMLAVTALIRPLAWEPPNAVGAAPKRQKTKDKEKKKKKRLNVLDFVIVITTYRMKMIVGSMTRVVHSRQKHWENAVRLSQNWVLIELLCPLSTPTLTLAKNPNKSEHIINPSTCQLFFSYFNHRNTNALP